MKKQKKKITTEEFIKRAKLKHGNKYDYSKTEYIGKFKPVLIICPQHGSFKQEAYGHWKGRGCIKCANREQLTTEEFIKRANEIHSFKFDYSKTKYETIRKNVLIICPEHGIFSQRPSGHLSGRGCSKCAGFGVFEEKAIKKYGNKYSYEKSKNNQTIKVICKKHGLFFRNVYSFLKGYECKNCINEINKKKFIKESIEIHNKKYDYSKVEFKSKYKKVILICKKHGEFKMSFFNHIKNKNGCPICSESKGEKTIRSFLENKEIEFIAQKQFDKCKRIKKLYFDFYIPKLKLCIEFDGEQHFRHVKGWGTIEKFKLVQERDRIKNEFCKKEKIRLERIRFDENLEERLKIIFSCNEIKN